MRLGHPAFALLTLLYLPTLSPGADLGKVDRTLKKEPAYKGKPLYGLLVFGPQASTRVWVVLDGTDLYVDRNGDGDLTGPGERLPNDGKDFKPFEVADQSGKDRYRVTHLTVIRNQRYQRVFVMADVDIVGNYQQYCDLTLAARPQQAPVAHFHGPLRLGLRETNWSLTEKLVRGDPPGDLFAWVGTFDRAHGCWVVVRSDRLPPGLHAVAQVEFSGARPVRQRYELKERC
jgi:hypothetical protein